MNKVTNSLSLQFNEAKDFYHNLASHTEDLTVKHALLKVSEVFSVMQNKANSLPPEQEFEQVMLSLYTKWQSNLGELKVGLPNQPHVSVLQQRIDIEKHNLSLLRRIAANSDNEAVKRWVADLTAKYLDAIESLTHCSVTKDSIQYER